jgi:hypothetical protein
MSNATAAVLFGCTFVTLGIVIFRGRDLIQCVVALFTLSSFRILTNITRRAETPTVEAVIRDLSDAGLVALSLDGRSWAEYEAIRCAPWLPWGVIDFFIPDAAADEIDFIADTCDEELVRRGLLAVARDRLQPTTTDEIDAVFDDTEESSEEQGG